MSWVLIIVMLAENNDVKAIHLQQNEKSGALLIQATFYQGCAAPTATFSGYMPRTMPRVNRSDSRLSTQTPAMKIS